MKVEKNVYKDISIEDVAVKRENARELPMRIFRPAAYIAGEKRATIIFWFGGGFYKNDMDHFRMQAEYFAHRGMVVITPDYRLTVEDGVKIPDCLYDAKSALLNVIENAEAYGVDKQRIVVSGGSAGGMMASSAVILKELDIKNESSYPCAMVLFNPALEFKGNMSIAADVKMVGENGESIHEDVNHLNNSLGEDMVMNPSKYSCMQHIEKGMPPTLIMQGSADPIGVLNHYFCKKYRELGNYVELEEYLGALHGFFNPGRSEGNFYYYQTLKRMEMFLIEQNLLARE